MTSDASGGKRHLHRMLPGDSFKAHILAAQFVASVGPTLTGIMAERVGFEPTLEFPLNTLSKRAPSATRPSLRRFGKVLQDDEQGVGPLPRFYWGSVPIATGAVENETYRG
jgi:hypothetical protein